MSFLLHIDTAVQTASVCLSNGPEVVALKTNSVERESASWLHLAIEEILRENNCSPNQLRAVAVSNGPGSYTGLRVGLAAAKGLCYALSIPLLAINTLQLLAAGLKNSTSDLLCPMIDARRMEVFTALFDAELNEVLPSTNLILEPASFNTWLEKHTITFFGNGSLKWENICQHPQAKFANHKATAADMALLAWKKFEASQFFDLAYGEPFYGKDFHSPVSKKNY